MAVRSRAKRAETGRPRSVARPATGRRGARQEVARVPADRAASAVPAADFPRAHRRAADAQHRRHRGRVGSLPRVSREIRRWDGRVLPDEATFAALIDDVRAAREAGTLAPRRHAAQLRRQRLSIAAVRDRPAAARRRCTGSARDALIEIDTRWGERRDLGVRFRVRRARSPRLLRAGRARSRARPRTAAIVGAPANEQAIFVQRARPHASALRRR